MGEGWSAGVVEAFGFLKWADALAGKVRGSLSSVIAYLPNGPGLFWSCEFCWVASSDRFSPPSPAKGRTRALHVYFL